jgi:hypothetical protein
MLTDDDIRRNPAMMGWIAEYSSVIRKCGYEGANLTDQYNLVQTFRLMGCERLSGGSW